jgi:hypothetical protein
MISSSDLVIGTQSVVVRLRGNQSLMLNFIEVGSCKLFVIISYVFEKLRNQNFA